MDNSKLNISQPDDNSAFLQIEKKVTIFVCVGFMLLICSSLCRAEKISRNEPNLIDIAKKKFCTLSSQEETLFCKVTKSEIADYSADEECVLRADRIAWLCTDLQASKLVTHRGIWVKGAHIKGKLDLAFAKVSFPLRFEKCKFKGNINLEQANLYALDFSGTHTHSIDANRLTVEGDVRFCNDFKAKGIVNLIGAKIGGYFNCAGGKFINKTKRGSERENKAIEATGVKVDGNVSFCDGFESMGTVSLYGATIGRELDCKGGKFTNPGWVAFNGDQMQVNGCVFLSEDFEAKGQVRLIGATIGRDLDCTNGKFIIDSKKATARKNTEESFREALKAPGLKVGGNVYLMKGFKADGTVELIGATIDGLFDCTGGTFINRADYIPDPNKILAIEATGLEVRGNVWLRGDPDANDSRFRAEGVVSLYGAKIGGDLDCKRGQFIHPKGTALCAEMLEVNQHVFLSENFHAKGEVRLESAIVNGYLFWGKVHSSKDVKELNLQYARIGMLNIDPNQDEWPDKVLLHGLVYHEISDVFAKEYETLFDWLQLQYGDPNDPNSIDRFWPQPYEQLADVLRKGGQDNYARRILIAKNRDRYNAQSPELTPSGRVKSKFVSIIDYGYSPLKALWWISGSIAFGCFLYGFGYYKDLITPPKESAYVKNDSKIAKPSNDKPGLNKVYPRFNFFWYSIDVCVPLIDLHQASYWLPNVNRKKVELSILKIFRLPISGRFLHYFFWFQIIVGWVLSTLLVVGATGLIRT